MEKGKTMTSIQLIRARKHGALIVAADTRETMAYAPRHPHDQKPWIDHDGYRHPARHCVPVPVAAG
jgi:hypothetical protein